MQLSKPHFVPHFADIAKGRGSIQDLAVHIMVDVSRINIRQHAEKSGLRKRDCRTPSRTEKTDTMLPAAPQVPSDELFVIA